MRSVAASFPPATARDRTTVEIDEILAAEIAAQEAEHTADVRWSEARRLAGVARFRRAVREYVEDPAVTVDGLYDLLVDRAQRDARRIADLERELATTRWRLAQHETRVRYSDGGAP